MSGFLPHSRHCWRPITHSRRAYATSTNNVKIVEVSGRDGIQNEKVLVPVHVKVELLHRLAEAGVQNIEAGSFVSPKWVPQMAGTAEVLHQMKRHPNVHHSVLVPNKRGLDNFLSLNSPTPLADEIAIFVAATDAFNKANLNMTVADCLAGLAPVAAAAKEAGLRVRGYVSVVVVCPYTGRVDYKRVREVAKELLDMGCYEVSLGDTVGMATPIQVGDMLEEVKKSVPSDKLAGHFHDTYGTAVANVWTALQHGIRTFDASVGGLGGCPYSPGATGNLATEDILYALKGSQYSVVGTHNGTIDLDKMVDIGWWISEKLGRESISRVGRAIRARDSRRKVKAAL